MSDQPEPYFLADAPKIALPESPPQEVALPESPPQEIPLPESPAGEVALPDSSSNSPNSLSDTEALEEPQKTTPTTTSPKNIALPDTPADPVADYNRPDGHTYINGPCNPPEAHPKQSAEDVELRLEKSWRDFAAQTPGRHAYHADPAGPSNPPDGSSRGLLLKVDPETASELRNRRAQNSFTAPEETSAQVRRRTNTLLSQAMQANRGVTTYRFPSATEIPLPASPETPKTPLFVPPPPLGIRRAPSLVEIPPNPTLQRTHMSNVLKDFSSSKNRGPPTNASSSSALSTPSSSDEEHFRGRTRGRSNTDTSRDVPVAAQNGTLRQQWVARVRAEREDEVVVLTLPLILAVLILVIATLVGVLFGAGVVYYLSL